MRNVFGFVCWLACAAIATPVFGAGPFIEFGFGGVDVKDDADDRLPRVENNFVFTTGYDLWARWRIGAGYGRHWNTKEFDLRPDGNVTVSSWYLLGQYLVEARPVGAGIELAAGSTTYKLDPGGISETAGELSGDTPMVSLGLLVRAIRSDYVEFVFRGNYRWAHIGTLSFGGPPSLPSYNIDMSGFMWSVSMLFTLGRLSE